MCVWWDRGPCSEKSWVHCDQNQTPAERRPSSVRGVLVLHKLRRPSLFMQQEGTRAALLDASPILTLHDASPILRAQVWVVCRKRSGSTLCASMHGSKRMGRPSSSGLKLTRWRAHAHQPFSQTRQSSAKKFRSHAYDVTSRCGPAP